jgi:hypothetical protein
MLLTASARKLIVLEINEISWELMDPWLKSGELPNFQRLQKEGAWGRTWADEPGGPEGLLEPWVTWTTFYTGVPHTQHGVKFLEQPVETIQAKRLWDLAAEGGKTIGIFASSGTWPPRPSDAFTVPGSFSQDSQTYPVSLQPIQDLNLRYTRSHAPGAKQPTKLETLQRGLQLWRLGLNAATVARVLKELIHLKRHPEEEWKKVCLQPVVNLPFFQKLYRRYQPDLATFHTNHVAHYQHRFMRAHQPDAYEDPTDPQEVQRFGGAIRYGYQQADWLLGKFLKLTARFPNTLLVVASSMGQQPYIPPKYGKVAPKTCRVRSIEKLIEVLSLQGKCEYYSVMAPQWNLRIPDAELRKATMHHLFSARFMPPNQTIFAATEVEDTLVVTPVSHHEIDESNACVFPTLAGQPRIPFDQLIARADETRKSGSHHPVGLLAFWGNGVKPGLAFGQINNLDVAPTLLSLLGLKIPASMKGTAIAATLLGQTSEPAANKSRPSSERPLQRT